jgi:glutamyl-Q tRNA(Asp) synthetase
VSAKPAQAAAYVGRFAPSPTGPLHAGSVLAALGSWLDARAHGGCWLVRIEDMDTPRCVQGADQLILTQLAALGLHADAPPLWQSAHPRLYQASLDKLIAAHRAYPCVCSRKAIEAVWAARGVTPERHQEMVYPGTCRDEASAATVAYSYKPWAWRFKIDSDQVPLHWQDRRLGAQQQDVARQVGDFVLRRADTLWTYQLAVVVDDAEQGISHVVRGQDLADNTPRQILLLQALGLPRPSYLHLPLVLGADGEKLSKQNGAQRIDLNDPLAVLNEAAVRLGLSAHQGSDADALAHWVQEWKTLYGGSS